MRWRPLEVVAKFASRHCQFAPPISRSSSLPYSPCSRRGKSGPTSVASNGQRRSQTKGSAPFRNNLRPLSLLVILLLAVSGISAQEEAAEETLAADPGILPDSVFYFLDEFFEGLSVGDDPERALRYKEEKIMEARVMAERRKAEFAKEALARASGYNTILEREVTPEMEVRIKQRSGVYEQVLSKISSDIPELKEAVEQQRAQEERIRLAAEVSSKIKQLCETLAQLDAEQYERTCKTEDAPRWQQKLDRELTQEQQAHARVFAEKLRECFASNGVECDCEGMRVPSFEAACIQDHEKAVLCNDGNQDACESMTGPMEAGKYLPAYLLPVLEKVQREFSEKAFSEAMERAQRDGAEGGVALPQPCRDAGASSSDGCMKLMEEKGLTQGTGGERFMFTSMKEFMEACEQRMSEDECVKQAEELQRQGFTEQPQAGAPARIGEFGRDCHAVKDLAEKSRCFEQFYEKAKQSVEMRVEWKYEGSSAVQDDWVSNIASKWFDTQTDEERAQLRELLMEELGARGIDADNVKLELDDERFELRYADSSGAEYRHEYKRDSRFGEERYEEKHEQKDDDDAAEAGAPAAEDERAKWEQYQKELGESFTKELEDSYEKYRKEHERREEAESAPDKSGSDSGSDSGSSGSGGGSDNGGSSGSDGESGSGSDSGR